MAKKKVIVQIEAHVEFDGYSRARNNERAARAIKRWLKETVENEDNVPLYLFKDDNGSAIEEIADITMVKITKCNLYNTLK